MKTATLIHQTAEKITIAQLTKGDVYKRLEPKTSYVAEKIVLGVVTDVLHNGVTAVVQATEFAATYSDVEPNQKVFGPDTELILFPAQPEDIEEHYAEIVKAAETKVAEAKRTWTQKKAVLTHVETVIHDLVSIGLAAAKAVAYIDADPEIDASDDGDVEPEVWA